MKMYWNFQFLSCNETSLFVLLLFWSILFYRCDQNDSVGAICLEENLVQEIGETVYQYDYVYITNLDWCPSCNMGFVEAFNKSNCDNILGIFLTQFESKKPLLAKQVSYPHARIFTVKELHKQCDFHLPEAQLYRIVAPQSFEQVDARSIYFKLEKCN